MTERRLDAWTVEEMVRTLDRDPNICIVLNPSMMPKTGMPRVTRDGKRRFLHRYLLFRLTAEETTECLLVACPTSGCMNPFHYERSMRRGRRVVTHCPNGHEYTPSNVEKHGRYKCKTCRVARLARNRKGEHGRGYCRHGHKLTKGNTYLYTTAAGETKRKCRRCTIDNQRRYRERRAMTHD